jgi:hypothetical protein
VSSWLTSLESRDARGLELPDGFGADYSEAGPRRQQDSLAAMVEPRGTVNRGVSWAEMATTPDRPGGVTALSLFFVFGATMSGLTAFLLSVPGTFLDATWRLNPRAHEGFASMGGWAVVLMIAVCAACTTAAIGLWRCERWGYLTAVTVLAINLAGDTLNAFVAHDWRTLIGLPVGGVMIAYLVTRRRRFVP